MFILPIIIGLVPTLVWIISPSTYNSLIGEHVLGLFMDYKHMRHDFRTIWSLFTVVGFVMVGLGISALLVQLRKHQLAQQADTPAVIGTDWGRDETPTPHKGIGKTHRWAVKPELLDTPRKAKKPRRKPF